MRAMVQLRDQENAAERKRRYILQDENKKRQAAAKLNEETKAAAALLKKRKREIEEAEAVLQAKYAIKQFSLEALGKGAKMKREMEAAKKRRCEVLDRLAHLGQGLSPAQRNDFSWFKESWDASMLEEHEELWPEMFMGWMQRILQENENGNANAFSVFVHTETRRCFDAVPSLRVP